MANESSYTIAPLSPETWSAFDALVQRHNGIFGGCWCIWFHPDGPERGQGAEANRALKKAYVEQGNAHIATWALTGPLLHKRCASTKQRPFPHRRLCCPLGSTSTTAAGTVALSDLKPTALQIFRFGRWLPAQCATTTLSSVGQDGRVGA